MSHAVYFLNFNLDTRNCSTENEKKRNLVKIGGYRGGT